MKSAELDKMSTGTGLEIAVIGMSGRFPGAENLHEFWNNLKNGIESISFFTDMELEDSGINPKMFKQPAYVRAKAVLKGVEFFDASFFDYKPWEATLMDPQVRIFHECVWGALEDAGYEPSAYNGRVGLFAGASPGFKWQSLTLLSGSRKGVAPYLSSILVDKDYLSTFISYKLNLSGPSFALQTACSTSLVAIHLAVQALLNGECEMALAGGVSLELPRLTGYMYQEAMIMSPDGHCRAFDQRALGTTVGEGAGVTVLKSLESAVLDRDHIYTVIKGSAINNDGGKKTGFTAPSVEGQAEIISAAQFIAEIEPESVGYIEAHGTGTTLGDPIEIEALKLAFNVHKKNFCAVGSVKTNIGHLDTAAGVAGFIKTVLAVYHGLIPPSLHFESPNPRIDFRNSPFYVNRELKEWKNCGHPLRAGISSFGIGGTNVHVVLEEWPDRHSLNAGSREVVSPPDKSRGYQLILLSAKTETALDKMTKNLAHHLKNNKDSAINLPDIAYTLQVGRKSFKHRRMQVCRDVIEAVDVLTSNDPARFQTFCASEKKLPLVFMFPGQGAQYVNMGLGLYQTEPVFREEMDRCFEILKSLMDKDIKEILYPPADCNLNPSPGINQTEIAQPVLFIFEYALAKLLMHWGIKPQAMMGHSIGEYTAACLAGVLSLQDALQLVVLRGRLMQRMPTGAMMSVPLSRDKLAPLLDEDVELAAVNSSSLCAVTGSHQAIESFEKKLNAQGITGRILHTSHAFHSKFMEPILEEFKNKVKQITRHAPSIPFISNLTGTWIKPEEVSDPGYWCKQLRRTVKFADGIEELSRQEELVFIEPGPGRVLSSFVRKYNARQPGHRIIDLVRHPQEEVADPDYLLDKIGQLWLYGVTIDWMNFYTGESRYRVPLPIYPFERKRFWLDKVSETARRKWVGNQLKPRKHEPSQRFYIPTWKPSGLPRAENRETAPPSRWLVFIDDIGLGSQLVRQLEKNHQEVIVVKSGTMFKKENHCQYSIVPGNPDDCELLFSDLNKSHRVPDHIVHLWNVTGSTSLYPGGEELEKLQESGFYNILDIARAIGNQGITSRVQLDIITNNMQYVTRKEALCPDRALVLGAVKVIPAEYVNISCRSIDVVLPGQATGEHDSLVYRLLSECESELPLEADINSRVIAYRGNHRYVQVFEPIKLEKTPQNEPWLREGGVYLITGGWGGIGRTFAMYLAETYHAKIILVGRTHIPDKDEWDKWLSDHGEENPVSRHIKTIRELETRGGQVLTFSADVSQKEHMQEVIRESVERFGQINGVCHAAGVADSAGVIHRRPREANREILFPKVIGTLVLDSLLKDVQLDFFILCSSMSSVQGAPGEVGYCAANTFLDAFSHYKDSQNCPFTISINWDTWQQVGMAVEGVKLLTGKALDTRNEEILKYGILPSEGLDIFRRVLAYLQVHNQVAVSHRDIRRTIKDRQPRKMKTPGQAPSPRKLYQRPDLAAAYVPPATDMEKKLAEIWENHLGIDKVGIYDNFFDLGANSMDIIQVTAKLEKAFKKAIPIKNLFKYPSIHALAKYLQGENQPGMSSPGELDAARDRIDQTINRFKQFQ